MPTQGFSIILPSLLPRSLLGFEKRSNDGLFPLFGGCHQLLTHTAELAIGHFHTLNDK
jgi:hypothetical protein